MITNEDIGKHADVDFQGGRLEAVICSFDGACVFIRANGADWKVPHSAVHIVGPRVHEARAVFAALTDDERGEVASDYCRSCFCPNPWCPCWNDE